MDRLATLVGDCRQLQYLVVDFPGTKANRVDIPVRPTACSLANLVVSTNHLTILHLDIGGNSSSTVVSTVQRDKPDAHLCLAINGLLGSLRRLRLRTGSMCPMLLRPPPGEGPIPLQYAFINLPKPGLSSHCARDKDGAKKLEYDIQSLGTDLFLRMARPKDLQIIPGASWS